MCGSLDVLYIYTKRKRHAISLIGETFCMAVHWNIDKYAIYNNDSQF